MSYDELAAARGIDKTSAFRMAHRRKWPKRKGNDGTVRLAVPVSVLEAKRPHGNIRADVQSDALPDVVSDLRSDVISDKLAIISALQGQIAAKDAQIEMLQGWLAAEKERTAKAEERADRAEARAETAEQRLIDELARLAALQHAPVPSVPETNGLDDAETAEVLAELEAEFAGHAESSDGQLATAVPDSDPAPELPDAGEGRDEVPVSPDTEEDAPAPRSWWQRLFSRRPRPAL